MSKIRPLFPAERTNSAFFWTLLLAFGWLLLIRALLILHSGVWPTPHWMLLSDMVGALILTLVLSLPLPKLLRLALMMLFATAYYAAGQHLTAHGTLFRLAHLSYAADPTFLAASVASPRLLLLPAYWLLAWVLLRLHRHIAPTPFPGFAPLLIPVLLLTVIYAAAIPHITAPANNVIASTLAQVPDALLSLRRPPEQDDIEPLAQDAEAMFFQPRIAEHRTSQPPDVLLILIEGLSSAYFPEVAAYHELEPVVSLPTLERDLETRGFRIYRNVLSMQRQTNRGSYALLCGTYPRLTATTPKMTDVAAGRANPVCLPTLLARAGYRTGYLQAAALQFMQKDAFMPRAGFEIVNGAEFFETSGNIEGWGPTDRVFFSAAADWVQELATAPGPWFAVTLNVGTHHPFPAEETAEPDLLLASTMEHQTARRVAFDTMAEALIEFLDLLKSDGVLEHTLVLITSDESGGFLRGAQEPRILDGNFGMLAVRPPGNMSLKQFADRNTLVISPDMALTVLDAAGLGYTDRMVGRSLLVTDEATERGILLGDTYAGQVFFMRESGTLLACDESLLNCDSWQFESDRLFGSLAPSSEPPFLDIPTRRRLIQRAAVIEMPESPSD